MTLSANTANRLFPDLRPEDQLLLCCARAQIDAELADQIKHLLSGTIDWEYLLNVATRHHLLPLLYWNLNRICPRELPTKVFLSLWEHFDSVARRNKALSLELVRLVKRFESHGIAVIPYKGPTAAALFYGEIALREFSDLDFLVRREDLSMVCDLLEADGYRVKNQLSVIQKRHHEQEGKEYLYCRSKSSENNNLTETICLEPHWSITMRKYPFPVDYSDLWLHAQRIEFYGAQLLSFAPEDTILILCVVGSKSQWKRLLMICDFAEAMRTFTLIDWEHCLERARKLGCERMLLVAVLLAGELLDLPHTHELLQHARSDRNVVRLAQEIQNRLFQEVRLSVLRSSLFSPLLWRLRERPRDKVQYLVRTLTTPRAMHLRRIPLPRVLFPLYRLIVPVHDYLLRPSWNAGKRLWCRIHPGGRAMQEKETT